MFRGKESSNNGNISISSGLIEFWCFGLPVAVGDGGRWVRCGVVGGAPTHVHVHASMHIYTLNMIISPLGESL